MGDCKTPYIYSEFSFLGRSYRSFATPSRVLKSRIFQDPRGTKKTYIGNTHTHTKKKLKLPNTIPPAIVFLLRIVYQNLQVLFLCDLINFLEFSNLFQVISASRRAPTYPRRGVFSAGNLPSIFSLNRFISTPPVLYLQKWGCTTDHLVNWKGDKILHSFIFPHPISSVSGLMDIYIYILFNG